MKFGCPELCTVENYQKLSLLSLSNYFVWFECYKLLQPFVTTVKFLYSSSLVALATSSPPKKETNSGCEKGF